MLWGALQKPRPETPPPRTRLIWRLPADGRLDRGGEVGMDIEEKRCTTYMQIHESHWSIKTRSGWLSGVRGCRSVHSYGVWKMWKTIAVILQVWLFAPHSNSVIKDRLETPREWSNQSSFIHKSHTQRLIGWPHAFPSGHSPAKQHSCWSSGYLQQSKSMRVGR